MTKTQTFIALPAIGLTLLAGGAIVGYAGLASAQTTSPATSMMGRMGMGHGQRPGVHGTVTAVSGSTITVNDAKDGKAYTIEASASTFKKTTEGAAPTAETLADIAVGDEVSARGTLSGTTLTATEVMEGKFFGRGHGGPGGPGGHGLMGKVTAVNGTTITVTDRDGTSYTVNAATAAVHKMTTGVLSDVQVGDTIGVQGDRSGTTVTAKTIMDGLPTPPNAPAQQ